MKMPAICVRDLSVCYANRAPVFAGFSMQVQAGEALLIQGSSGCGKSTLLHAICGLIPESISADISGEIELFGQLQPLTVCERAALLGIVFQNPETQLFCDSVEDEIAFGLENLCVEKREMSQRIEEVLAVTQLEAYRNASPNNLSGGQKQLVALAAALALNPSILLLDEALSQLDRAGKEALKARLSGLKQQGTTLLMVDHDEELRELADRVLPLEAQ